MYASSDFFCIKNWPIFFSKIQNFPFGDVKSKTKTGKRGKRHLD